jgi:hypothetical protein
MTRPGLSLIEVLASLLVLVLGMMAVIALLLSGIRDAGAAQAQASAWATAQACVHDPTPLGWQAEGPSGEGTLNGFFIRRREAPATSLGAARTEHEVVTVTVEVYQLGDGSPAAYLKQRILRVVPP